MKNSNVAEVLRIAMEYEKYLQRSFKEDSLAEFTVGFGYEFDDSAEMYAIVSSVVRCARIYVGVIT